MKNREISDYEDGDGDVNSDEDNCSRDDCDGCGECKISELLKNVSSVFIPFASLPNFFFSFPFLHTVVLEFPVYTALILSATPSCQ